MSEASRESQPTDSTPNVVHVAEDEPISLAVVNAVGEVSGRSPLLCGAPGEDGEADPLDPLSEVIDPDALNAICRPRTDDAHAKTVTFSYCGYDVTARSTGQVTVVEQ